MILSIDGKCNTLWNTNGCDYKIIKSTQYKIFILCDKSKYKMILQNRRFIKKQFKLILTYYKCLNMFDRWKIPFHIPKKIFYDMFFNDVSINSFFLNSTLSQFKYRVLWLIFVIILTVME